MSHGFLSCTYSCGVIKSGMYDIMTGTVTPTDVTCPECLDVLAKKAQQSGQKSE
jgi:hypothetical protein